MKLQIQILFQSRRYYVYSILEQPKEENKYAAQGDLQVSMQLTNQNLDADMCY